MVAVGDLPRVVAVGDLPRVHCACCAREMRVVPCMVFLILIVTLSVRRPAVLYPVLSSEQLSGIALGLGSYGKSEQHVRFCEQTSWKSCRIIFEVLLVYE